MSKLLANDNKVSLEEGARLIRERAQNMAARRALQLDEIAKRMQAQVLVQAAAESVPERREQVAEAIYNLNPEIQMWDGDPYSFHEATRRETHHAQLAFKQADAVLALEA